MKTNLILDDDIERYERAAATGGCWVWVKTVPEARELLEHVEFDHLAVDNDLGEGTPEGHTLLDWLEEMAYTTPSFRLPRSISVHSMNGGRLRSMQVAARRILEKGASR